LFVDPDGMAPYGDFLNDKGKKMGYDGKIDGKLYIVKSNCDVADDGITSSQQRRHRCLLKK